MPANIPRRILFHISPFASQKILTFHLWWICDPQWRSRFQPMLERLYPGSEFVVCCNTETMTVLGKRGYTFERDWRAFTLDQSETLDRFKYRALESLDHWHRTGTNNDHGRYLGAKMLEKFGSWTPDLVFSFLPAPYLRDVWPEAQIVYLESSVFSREPYPWTYYFDALGTMQNAFLSRHAAQINALAAPPETLRAVAEYRARTAALFERETRVKEYFAELRKRFRHIFLFACNLDHYFGVEAFSPYETQFEFLEHVMASVPPDTAVIVTQHPEPATTPLPERCLNDLKDVYPNLVADDFFFNMTNPSQCSLAFADGVIAQMSTVGLQAAFHRKYFVSVGTYFTGIADCTDLNGFAAMLERPPKDRDAFFAWTLTHYAIPEQRLEEFLPGMLDWMKTLPDRAPEAALNDWPAFPGDVFAEVYFPHLERMEHSWHQQYADNLHVPSVLRRLISERDDALRRLNDELAASRDELAAGRDELARRDDLIRLRDHELKSVESSVSFRLGRVLTWPLRTLRDLFAGGGKPS